jgi:Flp pilus assembly protein TadD
MSDDVSPACCSADLFDIGEYEQTIQMMDRVTALERTRREAYLYRFLSNVELGRGTDADADLDEALDFYPDLFEANLALIRAHILNERYGSAEQAVDKAETLAETDEQKALIYIGLRSRSRNAKYQRVREY